MCQRGIGWDEPLPAELKPRWESWLNDLEALQKLQIPRCFAPENLGKIQRVELHHFADASSQGYGQCSYVRVVSEEKVHCSFILGKARVAPTKVVTIPRLELTAAVVSSAVSRMLKEELELKIDPKSLEPLTPNHLITMKSSVPLPPPGKFVVEDLYAAKRWRRVQYLTEQFWSRWRKEYLANITLRQRWHSPRRNVKIGDVVIVKDNETHRNEWKLVLVKQEQRNEQNVAAAPSMPPAMPLAPPPSQPSLHLLRNQLSPPDTGQVHDSLLASPPRGLVPGLTHPQPAYSPTSSSSFQHLPSLQGHSLSMWSDCQLIRPTPAFHPGPAPAVPPPIRPSYQPMQHKLAYNGQPSLRAGSPQAYEQPDPAASYPLGLGMVYHPPP
ncbi:hypothetical protein SKAU_G00410960 [Synaphobranchus kaupii]|uniref:DUF5641 domain-containing protein n=1 Tax=Synaphobranchus kaupii TaxID=118154 RepID=A0A9Q1E7R4_SYNKA|nr:hypothetical protein SKAU_G00410960 [Synaphobranchus kaupii]